VSRYFYLTANFSKQDGAAMDGVDVFNASHGHSDGAPIHIACCFDQAYEFPFLVLANSIERHTSRTVVIHALHHGELRYAPRLFESSPNFSVIFREIAQCFEGPQSLGPLGHIANARLHLASLLSDVERVLYLDVDMLALHDIGTLFDTALGDAGIGAAVDHAVVGILPHHGELFGPTENRWEVETYVRTVVGLSDWTRYFNSGLMLMDLPRLEQRGVFARARAFLEQSRTRLICADQDSMNRALDGTFIELDPRWHCIATYMEPSYFKNASPALDAVGRLWMEPWLIHFTGRKPWTCPAALAGPNQLFQNEVALVKARWPGLKLD
jgi:lipopolysaccharide biosynthesis glycosyltransferase